MTTRVEKEIERKAVKTAKACGWKSRKITSPGENGAFDRVFIRNGRTVWIEYKDPERNLELDPLQEVEYEDLIAHGAEAYVCDSVEGTKAILGIKP